MSQAPVLRLALVGGTNCRTNISGGGSKKPIEPPPAACALAVAAAADALGLSRQPAEVGA
jgi:hypothetical protein